MNQLLAHTPHHIQCATFFISYLGQGNKFCLESGMVKKTMAGGGKKLWKDLFFKGRAGGSFFFEASHIYLEGLG